jgi:hypothetical protein
LSETSERLPEVIWLGERSEYVTTDFDGRVRRGTVLGSLRLAMNGPDRPTDPTYVRLRLEPSMPLDGVEHHEVVITERHQGTSLRALGVESISVYLFAVGQREDLERGVFRPAKSGLLAWADVAADPAYLPETQEQRFDRGIELLEQFVGREGHASVPPAHLEDGVGLGTWVANMKHSRQVGHLRDDWATRLEGLRGWRWYDRDEFALLDDYARREGHTDVPIDHEEDERALGHWVAFMRSSREHLPPDWIARLEAIPGWHW